eukprot:766896-Hanusia_phi.AAC.8
MKDRLQGASSRIEEQDKELRRSRLRKQATDLDGANEQANAAKMEMEVRGGDHGENLLMAGRQHLQRSHTQQLEEVRKAKDKLQKVLPAPPAGED